MLLGFLHRALSLLTERAAVALLALVIDAGFGDPPNYLHPVGAMGHWLHLGERLAPATPPVARLVWGIGWIVVGWLLGGGIGVSLPRQTIVQAALASLLLAYRGLDRAVAAVETALVAGDLVEARRLLGWHLVSRQTNDLSAAEVAGAAIESLAENLSDSVIAPVSALLVGGLPAMLIYRFTNTADAMWGYRTERFEYLGKVAARSDDLFNWLPARLTALLIALAAQIVNRRGRQALIGAIRDARRTASPNAGWPMAAMAGALDTVLTKREHYTLGTGTRMADAALIRDARRIGRMVMFLVTGFLLGLSVMRFVKQRSTL
ncbi:adenosylcobinamide-phosphate synthase CbiB [Chloroflexus sp.]|uniref:adenosylcobinamide-phosphate synthase CbiB n=1 Tax=Chloroflexus sp. TaxID=1904827 RepID=UPI003C74E6EC